MGIYVGGSTQKPVVSQISKWISCPSTVCLTFSRGKSKDGARWFRSARTPPRGELAGWLKNRFFLHMPGLDSDSFQLESVNPMPTSLQGPLEEVPILVADPARAPFLVLFQHQIKGSHH